MVSTENQFFFYQSNLGVTLLDRDGAPYTIDRIARIFASAWRSEGGQPAQLSQQILATAQRALKDGALLYPRKTPIDELEELHGTLREALETIVKLCQGGQEGNKGDG